MAKRKITKVEYEALNPVLKEEYIADGEGYVMDLEDYDDATALKTAKDHEKNKRVEAQKALRDAQAKLAALETEAANGSGDVTKVNENWQKKFDAAVKDAETKTARLSAALNKTLVDDAAQSFASRFTNPKVMLANIRPRVTADLDGDEPRTVILGKDGKPSNMTMDELFAEFSADKDFSGMIPGSKATGGAGAQKGPSGGATQTKMSEGIKLSKLSPADLVAQIDAK